PPERILDTRFCRATSSPEYSAASTAALSTASGIGLAGVLFVIRGRLTQFLSHLRAQLIDRRRHLITESFAQFADFVAQIGQRFADVATRLLTGFRRKQQR